MLPRHLSNSKAIENCKPKFSRLCKIQGILSLSQSVWICRWFPQTMKSPWSTPPPPRVAQPWLPKPTPPPRPARGSSSIRRASRGRTTPSASSHFRRRPEVWSAPAASRVTTSPQATPAPTSSSPPHPIPKTLPYKNFSRVSAFFFSFFGSVTSWVELFLHLYRRDMEFIRFCGKQVLKKICPIVSVFIDSADQP